MSELSLLRRPLAWLAAVAVGIGLAVAPSAHAAGGAAALSPEVLRRYQLPRLGDVQVEVLRPNVFQQQFGDNPDVPKTDAAVLQLSRQLYAPRWARAFSMEECGEYEFGRLFAALQNPQVQDATRDAVGEDADAAIPSLPKTYLSGHFRFLYTTNDPDADHNVTLADIQATAAVLNAAWDDYAARFKEPKHYKLFPGTWFELKLIDVKVYDLPPGLLGATNSGWNHIELDAAGVVRDGCKRQTTPVHELFHRVQYAYGYVTGTAGMKWAVEATASWSQKYRASHVGDWMSRMNSGLSDPDKALTSRSYDACHFWVYLGQRGGSEWQTIRDVWTTYQGNGKQMMDAVEDVIKSRIGSQYSLGAFMGWWAFANFYKDVSNASPFFDYQEDEWVRVCDENVFGPLAHVPATTQTLNPGSNVATNGFVSAYGADYHVFNLGALTRKVEINIQGSGPKFGYAVIELKDNEMVHYQRTPAGGWEDYSYTKNLTAGQLDQIAVVVIGNPSGGSYHISAKGTGLFLDHPALLEAVQAREIFAIAP